MLDLRWLLFDLPWFVLLQSFIDHLEPMHAYLDELKVYLGEGETRKRGEETGRTEEGGGRRIAKGRENKGVEEEIALLYLEAATKPQSVGFTHPYTCVHLVLL